VSDQSAVDSARATVTDALALRLYLQWREARLDAGYTVDEELGQRAMHACFDEAAAWLKLAEERRQAKA
jgi:hypothetical protein